MIRNIRHSLSMLLSLAALDSKLSLPEGWKVFIIQTVGLLK